MHQLRAGIPEVIFVDQGDFKNTVERNLELNGYKGTFIRADVFKQLDIFHAEGKKFDVIVSDPPAFKKSLSNRQAALQGYTKLHEKILKVLSNDSLLAVASCTHGVSLDDLDGTVRAARLNQNMTCNILDVGIQSGDHPFSSFSSKNYYIKYILYAFKNNKRQIMESP
jgi:23S rRNA (cytosine1962-C5)-methyltransferase